MEEDEKESTEQGGEKGKGNNREKRIHVGRSMVTFRQLVSTK